MKESLENLLLELKEAYAQSEIAKYCKENSKEWHYSLITTTLQPNGLLIIGFNWGVGNGHEPQSNIEARRFIDEELGSLSRLLPYFKELGVDYLNNVSQSNFCFFRSQTEDQITQHDIDLCKTIFHKMLQIVQPKAIFCFSSKLKNYMLSNNLISHVETHTVNFKRGENSISYQAVSGRFAGAQPIYFLPHPQFRMKRHARDEAWAFIKSAYQRII